MPHRVRPATIDDVPAIATAHVEGWRWAYRGLLPQEVLDGLSVARREELWRGLLAAPKPRFRTHVGEDDRGVFGFAHTGPARSAHAPGPDADAPEAGELYAIYLLEDRQGTGAGRAMMAAALDGLSRDGFRTCVLWVLAGNVLARRFYEHAGFRDDGGRKDEPVGGAQAPHVRYCSGLP